MYFDQERIKPEVVAAARDGVAHSRILFDLVARHGYAVHVARRVLAACLSQDDCHGKLAAQLPETARPCPHPIHTEPGDFEFEGRTLRVAVAHLYPPIYLIENVVSRDECEALIELARQSSRPSRLVPPAGGEAASGSYGRTNTTTPLAEEEGGLGVGLLRRFAKLAQWPASHCEGAEVQHYREGQYFDLHVDYLTPEMLQTNPEGMHSGNCMGNVLAYLNEPAGGGSTYFANLGLQFAPKAGAALFFSYPTMASDSMTLHAGNPVTAGEKFIATTVFRERRWKRTFHFDNVGLPDR